MEVWLFVFGLIAGSLLCIVLTHLSSKLDDMDKECINEESIKERKANKILYYNDETDLELAKNDIDTLITMICKKQLRMLKKDSCLYDSDKYDYLELLKAKLNNLNMNE